VNRIQKATLAIGSFLLIVLLLFPPWQQAAGDYRKSIGHGFILRPPQARPVDCYLIGCKTAPAPYFHVVFYSELYIAQCATVVFITVGMFVLFWNRGNTVPTLKANKTRLLFSMLLALAVPPIGDIPLASLLADMPRQMVHQDEKWQAVIIIAVVLFVLCSGFIYAIVTLVLWFYEARLRKPSSV
jgi:hypothetical protein